MSVVESYTALDWHLRLPRHQEVSTADPSAGWFRGPELLCFIITILLKMPFPLMPVLNVATAAGRPGVVCVMHPKRIQMPPHTGLQAFWYYN